MILSHKKIEEIAAAVIGDFNKFFFGDKLDDSRRFVQCTPIDQFAKDFLGLDAEAIRQAHERMQELDSEQSCSNDRLNAVCDEFRDSKALTFELTHAFIKAIYVHAQDNIEIVWKFDDFLQE